MILEDQIEIDGTKYEICGEIGEGGMGHVFVVRDKLNKKWALKVIKEYGRNPIVKQMVNKQIKIQSLFEGDPHIIQIVASKVDSKRMFIIFELGSCSLRNRMVMEAHIELAQFLRIAADISAGLVAIHSRNLIHRDIKPENIISVDQKYKITDFGSLHEGECSQSRIGTPLYLPPEIFKGSQYDQRLDVWSFGVSLFEAYFKIHPFYYSKSVQPMKQTEAEIRKNIDILTPHFSIEKLLVHLESKLVFKKECESIRNKVAITPQPVIELFKHFFSDLKQLPSSEQLANTFNSLVQSLKAQNIRKCELLCKLSEIPSDIQMYVITLNTFYGLSSKYGYSKQKEVERSLMQGIRYWSSTKYQGRQYVNCGEDDICGKEEKVIWETIRMITYNYWLELNGNKQLLFFEELPYLKIRVLICGARYYINTRISKFTKLVSCKLDRNIKDLDDIDDLLTSLSMMELRRIQDTLIHQYYLK